MLFRDYGGLVENAKNPITSRLEHKIKIIVRPSYVARVPTIVREGGEVDAEGEGRAGYST
jgi:hypothetical protein